MIRRQEKWINWCESNGRSYAGKNGAVIRQADIARLNKLKEQLDD